MIAGFVLAATLFATSTGAHFRVYAQDTLPVVTASSAVTTIVIVRHAEKGTDSPTDPSLSAEGQARAEALVAALDAADVKTVYSTPYKRTQGTGQPLAKRFKIEVTSRPINGRDIPAYAEQFAKEVLTKGVGKTVVIVGHSNTVPELVKAFSGRTVAAYAEDEYDRFYVITCPVGTGSARLFQSRYGKPSATATH